MSTNHPIAKKLQKLRWTFSVLLFFSAFTVHAQYVWSSEDYSKWRYDTFRQHPRFHDKFSPTDPDYLLLNAAVFYLTNEQRVKYGVYPLPYHRGLETAAYNHSLKMATHNFFSHSNNLDNSRKSTSDRAMLAGISNPYLAENIAYH
ncbi:MAG: CAP domain-containing protein [Schleiferiaceae bacterium]|nr:CAP domain-containing protein [Schleiferiaceae bacterium]